MKRAEKLLLIMAFGGLVCFGACNSGDNEANGDAAYVPEQKGDQDQGEQSEPWQVETIHDYDAGQFLQLSLNSQGALDAFYWGSKASNEGECSQVPVNPPNMLRFELYHAHKSSIEGSSWQTASLDGQIFLFGPTGLTAHSADDGTLGIAFTGGEPDMQYCAANDAIYGQYAAGQWQYSVAGAESGDYVTGNEDSDSGFVVGLWPSLAFDSAGNPAVVHQDVHFGALQHDDKYRADAEFAYRNGAGWTHESIDYGEGAGNYNTALFDGNDVPMAFYAITNESQSASRQGVWGARRTAAAQWERVHLHYGTIYKELAAAVRESDNQLAVAFFAENESAVRVRLLSDGDSFTDETQWDSVVVGDPRFHEGDNVSMAYLPSGKLALAYHRCKRISSNKDSCDLNDEALVFAYGEGSDWEYEVVYAGEHGSCGEYTSMAVAPDGTVVIGFRCLFEADGSYFFRPMLAHKKVE